MEHNKKAFTTKCVHFLDVVSPGGSSGCGSDSCTCSRLAIYLYTLLTPTEWAAPSGLAAAIEFDDDTGCLTFNGGTEAQIQAGGHVRHRARQRTRNKSSMYFD